MESLKQTIVNAISREGPITFERFMEMALYHPGQGYYARDLVSIGKSGDFYTGPHVHPIFGGVLARQLDEMWELLGLPQGFQVVEMGAGAGYLAKDLLDSLEGEDLYRIISYTIIEPNPFYRDRQRDLMARHWDKVKWLPDIDSLPDFTGCLISNELIDSFPVRLVEINEDLEEIFVSCSKEGGLLESKKPAPPEIRAYVAEFAPGIGNGYRTEINLRARDWLFKIAERLAAGFVLTIDYGFPASEYYLPERNRGTLLCYLNHLTNQDPFKDIGNQDITAHVNFSALMRWGEETGLKTLGYTSQGAYLVSLGIEKLLPGYFGRPPDPVELSKAKMLFMPHGLGESHKVLAQYKGKGNPGLKGFTLRNELSRL